MFASILEAAAAALEAYPRCVCGQKLEPLPSGGVYCPGCHPSDTLGDELDESELTIINEGEEHDQES
jgi:hypothetical protein